MVVEREREERKRWSCLWRRSVHLWVRVVSSTRSQNNLFSNRFTRLLQNWEGESPSFDSMPWECWKQQRITNKTVRFSQSISRSLNLPQSHAGRNSHISRAKNYLFKTADTFFSLTRLSWIIDTSSPPFFSQTNFSFFIIILRKSGQQHRFGFKI